MFHGVEDGHGLGKSMDREITPQVVLQQADILGCRLKDGSFAGEIRKGQQDQEFTVVDMCDNSPLKRGEKCITKVENRIDNLLMAFIRYALINTGEIGDLQASRNVTPTAEQRIGGEKVPAFIRNIII